MEMNFLERPKTRQEIVKCRIVKCRNVRVNGIFSKKRFNAIQYPNRPSMLRIILLLRKESWRLISTIKWNWASPGVFSVMQNYFFITYSRGNMPRYLVLNEPLKLHSIASVTIQCTHWNSSSVDKWRCVDWIKSSTPNGLQIVHMWTS